MGVELVFEAIATAKAAGRKLTIACTSALTDMAQCLGHPRWETEAPGVVSAVTVMCSAAHGPEGIALDEEAQNARYDLKAARYVYSTLQAQRDIRFTVVTRHSAAACRLQRNSLNGSLHPVAKRLASTGRPNLQARHLPNQPTSQPHPTNQPTNQLTSVPTAPPPRRCGSGLT